MIPANDVTIIRNVIGRNPSMVIPFLVNQDLTPMLITASCTFVILP